MLIRSDLQLFLTLFLSASNVGIHSPHHAICLSSFGPGLQTGNIQRAPAAQPPTRPTQSENARPCPPPASHSAHFSPSRCASGSAASAAHPGTRASSCAAACQNAARRLYAQTDHHPAPSRRAATTPSPRLHRRRRRMCCLRAPRGVSQSVRPSRRCGRSWAAGRERCLVVWRGLRPGGRRLRSCGRSRDECAAGLAVRCVDGACLCRRRCDGRGRRGWCRLRRGGRRTRRRLGRWGLRLGGGLWRGRRMILRLR